MLNLREKNRHETEAGPKTRQLFHSFLEDAPPYQKYIFFAPTTLYRVKAGLALGLLYCLSPLDLIPDWISVLRVMDDLGLTTLLITWANRFTLPEEASQTGNGNKAPPALPR